MAFVTNIIYDSKMKCLYKSLIAVIHVMYNTSNTENRDGEMDGDQIQRSN
mgnify:CR=1 FL=1